MAMARKEFLEANPADGGGETAQLEPPPTFKFCSVRLFLLETVTSVSASVSVPPQGAPNCEGDSFIRGEFCPQMMCV